jgi:hypothetical protein
MSAWVEVGASAHRGPALCSRSAVRRREHDGDALDTWIVLGGFLFNVMVTSLLRLAELDGQITSRDAEGV